MARDESLRAELLRMAEEDQDARRALDWDHPPLEDSDALDRLRAVDERNTARMRKIVEERGWPGTALVGEDGATAAWLLAQHTPDRAFQRRCLTLMEEAVRRGEADLANLAYLTDRVLLFEGKPQRYGTQLRVESDVWVPAPIEDEERVDERRHEIGLPPLADYIK
jgi:hypothetical protein